MPFLLVSCLVILSLVSASCVSEPELTSSDSLAVGEAVSCKEYAPVDKTVLPDWLVRGHAQAVLPAGYADNVRKAYAVVEELFSSASGTCALNAAELREAIRTIHCNYLGLGGQPAHLYQDERDITVRLISLARQILEEVANITGLPEALQRQDLPPTDSGWINQAVYKTGSSGNFVGRLTG